MYKNELEPIKFESELCKGYYIMSCEPIPVYVEKNQPTVSRYVTKESYLFGQYVNLSGNNLFDFGILNRDYLNKIGIYDINSLQQFMDEHLIHYIIKKI